MEQYSRGCQESEGRAITLSNHMCDETDCSQHLLFITFLPNVQAAQAGMKSMKGEESLPTEEGKKIEASPSD